MDTNVQHEVDKIKRKLLSYDDPSSLRRGLAQTEPVQILTSIFESCLELFSGFQKVQVANFIQFVTKNKRGRDLFTLAIYRGAYKLDTAILASGESVSVGSSTCSSTTEELRRNEESFRQPPGEYIFAGLRATVGSHIDVN